MPLCPTRYLNPLSLKLEMFLIDTYRREETTKATVWKILAELHGQFHDTWNRKWKDGTAYVFQEVKEECFFCLSSAVILLY